MVETQAGGIDCCLLPCCLEWLVHLGRCHCYYSKICINHYLGKEHH